MVAIPRSIVLLTLVSTFAVAGERGSAPPTRYQTQLSLFGVSPAGFPSDTVPPQSSALPAQPGKKSVGLAALYSLLLPGMGELYAGGFSSGRYFLAAEGLLWLTYIGFDVYASSVRTDARTFAVSHAGIDPAGKQDQYYVDIGNFMNIDEYNQKKLRDRDLALVYDPAAGYAWQWDSDASRANFKDLRIKSDQVFNNMRYVGAAILVNHIASAINAARTAIAHNNALASPLGDLQIGARVLGSASAPDGLMITVVKGF
jgi:hypothetical protein